MKNKFLCVIFIAVIYGSVPETYNTFTRTSTVKAHVAVKENKKAKALKAFYADEAETFMLND